MKLITFAVPCYNSASYMDRCIQSLLVGGEDTEIVLVDDGSTDGLTSDLADRYAAEYPDRIRTIHQPNGGHGEGVNRGLEQARGLYYKVVDSDDWLDGDALRRVLGQLRWLVRNHTPVDLMVCNYVYEHTEDQTSRSVRYNNVFPEDRIFTWQDAGRFREGQFLLMHSAVYRTEILRKCGMTLPGHTYYVDNIFVYQPLPFVKTLYYMDENLYHYLIGREDQSVNENVMVNRVDQQIRITKIMTDCCDLRQVYDVCPGLARYMVRYLAMMYTICSTLLVIDGSSEALQKRTDLWEELSRYNAQLYRRLRYRSLAFGANLPGRPGRKFCVAGYHVTQKIYKFN